MESWIFYDPLKAYKFFSWIWIWGSSSQQNLFTNGYLKLKNKKHEKLQEPLGNPGKLPSTTWTPSTTFWETKKSSTQVRARLVPGDFLVLKNLRRRCAPNILNIKPPWPPFLFRRKNWPQLPELITKSPNFVYKSETVQWILKYPPPLENWCHAVSVVGLKKQTWASP